MQEEALRIELGACIWQCLQKRTYGFRLRAADVFKRTCGFPANRLDRPQVQQGQRPQDHKMIAGRTFSLGWTPTWETSTSRPKVPLNIQQIASTQNTNILRANQTRCSICKILKCVYLHIPCGILPHMTDDDENTSPSWGCPPPQSPNEP